MLKRTIGSISRRALRDAGKCLAGFLAVLQLLTPRQRTALILRDVLDWPAVEAAEISGMSVSALNSALHRARQTMAQHYQCESSEAGQARTG